MVKESIYRGKLMGVILLTPIFFIFSNLKAAFAEFDVKWGESWDNGNMGYEDIAGWLLNNGYYTDYDAAINFATTGYIGAPLNPYNDDPFYWWSSSSPFNVEIVQEIASYQNQSKLGYYAFGFPDYRTEIFNETEKGPALFNPAGPYGPYFGLYIDVPYNGRTNWYTDRFVNFEAQSGVDSMNEGGDAQALVYELIPNQQWLIAWEDYDATQPLGATDNDYNDMYVRLTATPEPLSCALFLLGGGALFAGRRLRRKTTSCLRQQEGGKANEES